MTTIANHFGPSDHSSPNEKTVFGLECEIEDIHQINETLARSSAWKITEDGSLRNGGREFISCPLSLEEGVYQFQKLHENLALGMQAFSERTSIHVHVNCQSRSLQQVRNTVLMYALFEPYFFKMVHPIRQDNIHCVPLTQTHLPDFYGKPIETMVSKWHKYTALNLKPLAKYGTIEFRHMNGHGNTELLGQWLSLLNRLFDLAEQAPITAKTLTMNNYREWFSTLFSPLPFYEDCRPSLAQDSANSRLDVKLGVM